MAQRGSDMMQQWPEESREAARLVIDTYGEPHEATESVLTSHGVGPWKRVLASRTFHEHRFPAPADPDTGVLSDTDLERAVEEGKRSR